MKNIKLIVLLLIFGLVLIETKTHFTQTIVSKYVVKNYYYYFVCENLPDYKKVKDTVNKNKSIVNELIVTASKPYFKTLVKPVWDGNSITGGKEFLISFDIRENKYCPGKADILISYPGEQDRKVIEGYLDNNEFFDIPVRFDNN